MSSVQLCLCFWYRPTIPMWNWVEKLSPLWCHNIWALARTAMLFSSTVTKLHCTVIPDPFLFGLWVVLWPCYTGSLRKRQMADCNLSVTDFPFGPPYQHLLWMHPSVWSPDAYSFKLFVWPTYTYLQTVCYPLLGHYHHHGHLHNHHSCQCHCRLTHIFARRWTSRPRLSATSCTTTTKTTPSLWLCDRHLCRWSTSHCEISGWGMQEYNNTASYPDSVRAARIEVAWLWWWWWWQRWWWWWWWW